MCVRTHLCVQMHTHSMACMWRLEDSGKLILFFCHVGPRDQIQVLRLDGKYLYPSADSKNCFFTIESKKTPRGKKKKADVGWVL